MKISNYKYKYVFNFIIFNFSKKFDKVEAI